MTLDHKPGDVQNHYAGGGLGERILEALRGNGLNVEALSQDDLAAVDEFHIRGREATAELAKLAEITPRDTVLDVGCGIGGPSRFLAHGIGCHVTGLDLTQEFCDVADMLAARTGLADKVAYRQGDALELPFGDTDFDVVWTQHTAMNIPDKPRLYGEMFRVMKPGGRLAIYDVLSGLGGEVQYPVPWAREADISFMQSPDELRANLEGAGFEVVQWQDVSTEGIAWVKRLGAAVQAREPGTPSPPSVLGLIFGKGWHLLAANLARNLIEGRILATEVVARKPA